MTTLIFTTQNLSPNQGCMTRSSTCFKMFIWAWAANKATFNLRNNFETLEWWSKEWLTFSSLHCNKSISQMVACFDARLIFHNKCDRKNGLCHINFLENNYPIYVLLRGGLELCIVLTTRWWWWWRDTFTPTTKTSRKLQRNATTRLIAHHAMVLAHFVKRWSWCPQSSDWMHILPMSLMNCPWFRLNYQGS